MATAVESISKPEHWTTAALRYQERLGHSTSHAAARIVDYVNQSIPFKDDSYCLDVGAGGGSGTMEIRQKAPPATKILATDISPGMLNLIDALELPNVYTQQEDALTLSGLKDETFSHVFTSMCIQFTPDPAETVRQMYRVLKPGGMAGIMIWGDYHGLSDIHNRACRLIKPDFKPVSPYTPHAWANTRDHAEQMRAAGFQNVNVDCVLMPFPAGSGQEYSSYAFEHGNPVMEKMIQAAENQGIKREELRATITKLVDEKYEGGKGVYATAVLGWGSK